MKFKATAKSLGTLEAVTWTLRAGSLEKGLVIARDEAAHIFADEHELRLESIDGNAKSILKEWSVPMAMVIVAVVSILGSSWLRYQASKDKIKHEVLQQRQEALFDALRVVDYFYASVDFKGRPRLNYSKWDIQMARDAMNKMLIYCARPETTVKAFMRTIGCHNPEVESAPAVTMAGVNNFRKEVARELGLPVADYDPDKSWIYTMPGTTEDSVWKSTRHRPQ